MSVKMKNCGAQRNKGDGIRVAGDVDLTLDGFQSSDNGGHGYNFLPEANVMTQLGLPADTDPALVKSILNELLSQNAKPSEEVIKSSGLFEKVVAKGADLSTIAANFSTLAANPAIQSILKSLGV
jgi:hypothetical protein